MTKTPHKPVYECRGRGCSLPVGHPNELCRVCLDDYAGDDGLDAESASFYATLADDGLEPHQREDFWADAIDAARDAKKEAWIRGCGK